MRCVGCAEIVTGRTGVASFLQGANRKVDRGKRCAFESLHDVQAFASYVHSLRSRLFTLLLLYHLLRILGKVRKTATPVKRILLL